MKNVTVNVQIQFDVFSDDIKEEIINSLNEMSTALNERFNDRSPIIFTSSIDSSDFEVHADEDEDEDGEIDARDGVETNYGHMEVIPRMLETDGTNLEEGVDVRIEGEFIGEVIGATSVFESVEALEEWYLNNFDPMRN